MDKAYCIMFSEEYIDQHLEAVCASHDAARRYLAKMVAENAHRLTLSDDGEYVLTEWGDRYDIRVKEVVT